MEAKLVVLFHTDFYLTIVVVNGKIYHLFVKKSEMRDEPDHLSARASCDYLFMSFLAKLVEAWM